MTRPPLALFSLHSGRSFGERVAGHLAVPLAAHEEREFEWGQHKARPIESVRGADAYVIQSLHGQPAQSVNDKLCRLLFFLGALRDAGASRVTAVVPYLCYSRKDRQTKHRDPVTTRFIASLFEAMDVDRIVTLEIHNLAAFQNAFRCRTEHLGARAILAEAIAGELAGRDPVLVSPDLGGIKRINSYRVELVRRLGRDVPLGLVEKQRSEDVVTGDRAFGAMHGRVAILVDDMISTGETLVRAADRCREAGAVSVIAAAAHGVFVPSAGARLGRASLDKVFVLDHVAPAPFEDEQARAKIVWLDSTSLFADAIGRLHQERSLGDLLDP